MTHKKEMKELEDAWVNAMRDDARVETEDSIYEGICTGQQYGGIGKDLTDDEVLQVVSNIIARDEIIYLGQSRQNNDWAEYTHRDAELEVEQE